MKQGKKSLDEKIAQNKEELTNLQKKSDTKGLDIFQNNQKSILGSHLEKPPPLSYYVSEFKYNSVGPTNILKKNGTVPSSMNEYFIIQTLRWEKL